MPTPATDPISPWFTAAEELGEYIGIRFGHVPSGASKPEWIFLRHTDFDGIGGLADILRRRGVTLDRLAQIKYPGSPSWGSLVAGLFIGVVQSMGALMLGAEAAHVLVFVVMIAVLIFRPQGMMGKL